jgi:uncharacterized protein (TIGR04255 family)
MHNVGSEQDHRETSLFPASERVIYAKAPLIEVIVQLRFPPIYAIQAAAPADFQEIIRRQFPLVEETPSLPLLGGIELPPEMRKLITAKPGDRVYQFLSEDKKDTITLAKDMIGFSTKKYVLWEQFSAMLTTAISALVEVYRPAFYSRIGLRYIDAINRELIGIGQTKWSELLNRDILGELNIPIFEDNLLLANRQIVIRFPDNFGALLLQHGLGSINNMPTMSYVIDFDFYRESKTEIGDANAVLDRFHDLAGRAFRWCITNKLHDSLVPRKL